jgi:hypothetical protein
MKARKFFLISGMIFVTCVTINAVRFQYGLSDAFWRTIMTPFEGTVWASEFKESEFSKVQIGMLETEVMRLLGSPLRKDCNEKCFWIYTWQVTGTADFDQRWVIFDLNQKVVEIRKSFFID